VVVEQHQHEPVISESIAAYLRAPFSEYKERRTCFRCNVVGHLVADCPLLDKVRQLSQKTQLPIAIQQSPRRSQPSHEERERIERDLKWKKKQTKQVEKAVTQTPIRILKRGEQIPQSCKTIVKPQLGEGSSSSSVVDQQSFYHKRFYNKKQLWLPKETEIPGVSSVSHSGSSSSSKTVKSKSQSPKSRSRSPEQNQESGFWTEIIIQDGKGGTKTVKAWVPTTN
jgi:hypothetical protein